MCSLRGQQRKTSDCSCTLHCRQPGEGAEEKGKGAVEKAPVQGKRVSDPVFQGKCGGTALSNTVQDLQLHVVRHAPRCTSAFAWHAGCISTPKLCTLTTQRDVVAEHVVQKSVATPHVSLIGSQSLLHIAPGFCIDIKRRNISGASTISCAFECLQSIKYKGESLVLYESTSDPSVFGSV